MAGVQLDTSTTGSPITIGNNSYRILLAFPMAVETSGGMYGVNYVRLTDAAGPDFTEIITRVHNSRHLASAWYYMAPPTGSQTVVVDFDATSVNFSYMPLMSLYGVNPKQPLLDSDSAISTSTSISLTLNSEELGGLVIDAIKTRYDATPGSGQTQWANLGSAENEFANASRETGSGGSVVMSWSISVGSTAAQVAVSLRAAAGGQAPTWWFFRRYWDQWQERFGLLTPPRGLRLPPQGSRA